MTGSATAIVLAAGEGERIGRGPKAFIDIGGRTILEVALAAATACPEVASLVVVVPAGFDERIAPTLDDTKPCAVVAGGRNRHDSVRLGLGAVPKDVGIVVCHDAARPFASPELFSAVIRGLDGADGIVGPDGPDGVVPGLTPSDTVKRVRDGVVEETLPREHIRLAQTPQAFVATVLRDAHARAAARARTFTDDAGLLEWAGYRVRVVTGEPVNFKITSADDLARAERFLLESARDG